MKTILAIILMTLLFATIGMAQWKGGKVQTNTAKVGVIDDSLRVGGTSTINGKLIVADSLRVQKTALISGATTMSATLNLNATGIVQDSLRVGKTVILNGTATVKTVIGDTARVKQLTIMRQTVSSIDQIAGTIVVDSATGALKVWRAGAVTPAWYTIADSVVAIPIP